MKRPRIVTLPYTPRVQQETVHDALETHRFVVVVCHRRMGKSVLAINQLIKTATELEKSRPRCAYIAPTFRMAKQTVWDYLKFYAKPFEGVSFNESELRADFLNGGQVRLYGGDDPDTLRGLYLDGAVLDEFGMHQQDVFSSVVRPALVDRQGWALFLGTPNGKNQFYDVVQRAKTDSAWFFAEYKASQTGIISRQELALARQDMTQDEYDQEFECSFEAAVKGAIYSLELAAARGANRVTVVPVEPVLPVDTDWDLGVGDSTAIWFSQSLRSGEVRLVDYYEASGEGLPHYAQVLQRKGYTYGSHWAPFDIEVKELGSGRSRLETAKSLGITFKIAPKLSIEDGIHAARMLFPKCWFDAVKCAPGLEALQHYRRDYNTRIQEFKPTAVHDWASHGADAFRYLAVRQKTPVEKVKRPAPMVPTGEHAWLS